MIGGFEGLLHHQLPSQSVFPQRRPSLDDRSQFTPSKVRRGNPIRKITFDKDKVCKVIFEYEFYLYYFFVYEYNLPTNEA